MQLITRKDGVVGVLILSSASQCEELLQWPQEAAL
jgi:hypothetical protein